MLACVNCCDVHHRPSRGGWKKPGRRCSLERRSTSPRYWTSLLQDTTLIGHQVYLTHHVHPTDVRFIRHQIFQSKTFNRDQIYWTRYFKVTTLTRQASCRVVFCNSRTKSLTSPPGKLASGSKCPRVTWHPSGYQRGALLHPLVRRWLVEVITDCWSLTQYRLTSDSCPLFVWNVQVQGTEFRVGVIIGHCGETWALSPTFYFVK